jgi:pimeloyl-ACP methyl ester carboxylesterase
MRIVGGALLLSLAFTAVFTSPTLPTALVSAGQMQVLSQDGNPISRLTDGDTVRLRLTLPEPSSQATPVVFSFEGDGYPLAECTIPQNEAGCDSGSFAALGWYWDSNGTAAAGRSILAGTRGAMTLAISSIEIAPRPVVMVHGFSSSWEAWVKYVGPEGYLAASGLAGFAVGDGRVPGTLNTGNLAAPDQRTNTIAENAVILGKYIANVRQATGAQTVDLIAHSMGGLISRYYIDGVMQRRDVSHMRS